MINCVQSAGFRFRACLHILYFFAGHAQHGTDCFLPACLHAQDYVRLDTCVTVVDTPRFASLMSTPAAPAAGGAGAHTNVWAGLTSDHSCGYMRHPSKLCTIPRCFYVNAGILRLQTT